MWSDLGRTVGREEGGGTEYPKEAGAVPLHPCGLTWARWVELTPGPPSRPCLGQPPLLSGLK